MQGTFHFLAHGSQETSYLTCTLPAPLPKVYSKMTSGGWGRCTKIRHVETLPGVALVTNMDFLKLANLYLLFG